MDRINLDPDVDGVRLETLRSRGSHESVTFRPTRMISNPSFRLLQVASERDWVPNGQLREERARLVSLAIQHSLHELGHSFRTKRSHGNGKMQALVFDDICPSCQQIERPAS